MTITVLKKPKKGPFLFCPCSCHILNLVLIDTFKNNSKWNNYLGTLRDIGKNYNKAERNQLERHFCPEHVATRWVNDVDVAYFLYMHKEIAIMRIPDRKEFIDSYLHDILVILLPFRSAIQILEGDFSMLADIYPIFEEVYGYYDLHKPLLKNSASVEIVDHIIFYIKQRVSKKLNGHLLLLAYSLTPAGRREIRQTMQKGTFVEDNFQVTKEYALSF